MLFAAIDIHKHAFQAAVLDLESGEVVEERFSADRESLAGWAASGAAESRRWRSRRRPGGAGSGATYRRFPRRYQVTRRPSRSRGDWPQPSQSREGSTERCRVTHSSERGHHDRALGRRSRR